MAALYAEHPNLAGGYERNWDSLWGAENPYFPASIAGADAALEALADFTLPASIAGEARRAAARLTNVFSQVARLRVVHDLTAGRLDRRKLKAVARHTAAGTYDPNVIRPYRRTLPTPAETPTLAVVTNASNAMMWSDPNYIPRALTLTLGVLWACEAAGLNAYGALVEGHSTLRHARYREAVYARMLAEPGAAISPRVYGVALHRDLWRHGRVTAAAADKAGMDRLMALKGRRASAEAIYSTWPSRNGGAAVRWAREVLGADLVIGVGTLTDLGDADIQLPDTSFSVADAVKEIAVQARRL